VSGKGISAALLMAFVRPILRTAMDRSGDPVAALERTNWILASERHTGLFVTAVAAAIDLDTGEATIANAGHELPIVVRADGTIAEIEGGGPLLGAFGRLDAEPARVQLGPGDRLLLYTDGVTDAQSPAGERFGLERLLAAIGAVARDPSPDALVASITNAVTTFRGTAEPADDVALLVAGRSPQE
jgi:sigma-B regulation protein RsbU (phosphoserine phosphatase)